MIILREMYFTPPSHNWSGLSNLTTTHLFHKEHAQNWASKFERKVTGGHHVRLLVFFGVFHEVFFFVVAANFLWKIKFLQRNKVDPHRAVILFWRQVRQVFCGVENFNWILWKIHLFCEIWQHWSEMKIQKFATTFSQTKVIHFCNF